MSKETPPRTLENRDYFRISQDIIFNFTPVDAFAADNDEAENAFEDGISLNLLHELKRLDRDSEKTLRFLTEKNRLLGDYLQTLSAKIDLMARHILFAQQPDQSHQSTSRVNLSEDGIAFSSDRALYKDSYIAVRLIFLPSYSPVLTHAKVLRCEQKGDDYQIAAKFYRTPDVERQELSKQILKAQVASRKKQPRKPDSEDI